ARRRARELDPRLDPRRRHAPLGSRRARALACESHRASPGRADVRWAEVPMSRPVLIAPEVLLATPAAALLASVPAAFRLAGGQVGFFEGWFAAAGLLCPLVVLLVAAARGARRAVR